MNNKLKKQILSQIKHNTVEPIELPVIGGEYGVFEFGYRMIGPNYTLTLTSRAVPPHSIEDPDEPSELSVYTLDVRDINNPDKYGIIQTTIEEDDAFGMRNPSATQAAILEIERALNKRARQLEGQKMEIIEQQIFDIISTTHTK